MEARAVDDAGNEGTAGPVLFTIDTAVPVVSGFSVTDASSADNTLTNEREVSISAAADGTGSAIARWRITETGAVPTIAQMNAGSPEAPVSYSIQSPGDGVKSRFTCG